MTRKRPVEASVKPDQTVVSASFADVSMEMILLLMKERPGQALITEGAADALRAVLAEKRALEELCRRLLAEKEEDAIH